MDLAYRMSWLKTSANYLLTALSSLFLSTTVSAATSPSSGMTEINGINMYYEIHGQGKPVVLIAGFGCDHAFWSGILGELAKNHQVLIFDNRGIGRSSVPNSSYSIDTLADDAMALINKLGMKRPIIIGQSMGSAIAQNMAKRFPSQINKIVLINTFYKIEKAPEIAFTLTGELQKMNVGLSYRVQSIAPWVYSSEFLAKPNQLANLIKLAEANPYPQSLVSYEQQLAALKAFNSLAWLHEVNRPTLVIAADEDIIAPLKGAKMVTQQVGKQATLVVIPGGHASPIEQPQKVVKEVLGFIG